MAPSTDTQIYERHPSPNITTSNHDIELITYIIPDFNAVNYFQREFEQENEFSMVEYTKASGFDIYMVEQWVTNRNIGILISTFTGNPGSEVNVIKFTTVKKPSKYYPLRFQEYLNELMMNHSKIKQMDRVDIEDHTGETRTTDEYLFITNITSLPSHLSLIPILGGDIRLVHNDFIVNSNLKRLHCSGRSISLISPKISDANEDKFRQMYRIYNLNVPIKFAILELINIIQTCLFYFDLLDARYCDGLLCAKTEDAIINWWNLIGLPHFNIKPNHRNEILPSRTVSAIISMILSTRIRLQIFGGCDVPKDPFEVENFMISIGEFQRQVKLEKKRKLNVETLGKLFYITNSKLNPDRYRFSNDTGDESFVDGQSYNSSLTTDNELLRSPRANNNGGFNASNDLLSVPQTNTPVKRNNRYTKEFKKLTSAVKSTVQDRIYTVGRAEDGVYLDSNPNKATRLRDRFAKLGDSTNPFEVETLDLEVLVQNYLVGKTLQRLWVGLSGHKLDNDPSIDRDNGHKDSWASPHTSPPHNRLYTSPSKHDDGHHHTHHTSHHHHHNSGHNSSNHIHSHHSHHGSDHHPISPKNTHPNHLTNHVRHQHHNHHSDSSKLYKFESLKDVISNNQRLPYDSRYNRGLNKMKLGLQRNLLSNQPKKFYNAPGSLNRQKSQRFNPNLSTGLSKVDALLKIPSESSDEENANKGGEYHGEQTCENAALRERNELILKFDKRLNRRNSYPFVAKQGENNLNLLELSQEEPNLKPKLNRRNSMSIIETFKSSANLITIEKVTASYLNHMSDLIHCDNYKKYYNFNSKGKNNLLLEKRVDILNKDLGQLKMTHRKLENSRAKILKDDLPSIIDMNMKNLNTNIDRLVYESRIIVKRINELESNSKLLRDKLRTQNLDKLTNMVNNLIFSNRFHKAFQDEAEKEDIILKLTGENKEILSIVREQRAQFESNSYLRIVVTFIWDMIMFIFQLFRFDRSNMNLDRIRGTWNKLDPNREYINRAYEFVGHDSTTDGSIVKRGSINSLSTNSINEGNTEEE